MLSGRSAFGASCSNNMLGRESVKTKRDNPVLEITPRVFPPPRSLLPQKCLSELLNTYNMGNKLQTQCYHKPTPSHPNTDMQYSPHVKVKKH